MPNKTPDPIQKKLRDHKKRWNNEHYKNVSRGLKAIKDGINGHGNSIFSLPIANIKDALPNQIPSFLDQLVSEFNALVSDAKSIIDEQESYSHNRRKKQPKQQVRSVSPNQENQVVNTLSNLASFDTNDLEKFGSSGLSRFWQYLTSFFSRDELNKYRISMLRATVDLHSSLLDFENDILTLDAQSIFRATRKYQAAYYDLNLLNATLNHISSTVNHRKNDETKKQNKNTPDKSQTEKAKEIATPESRLKALEDSLHLLNDVPGVRLQSVMDVYRIFKSFKNEQDPQTKSLLADRLNEAYTELLNESMSSIQNEFGQSAKIKSPEDLIELSKKNNNNSNKIESKLIDETEKDLEPSVAMISKMQITKLAHNSMTRFLKRQLAKVKATNKTVSYRLQISDIVEHAEKELGHLMDLLENASGFTNLIEISESISKFSMWFNAINEPLSILSSISMQNSYNMKSKQDIDSMFSDVVKRKMKEDMRRGINGK